MLFMTVSVIVVGHPDEPRLKSILCDPLMAEIPYELCPDAVTAAACLAGKEPGIILGPVEVLCSRQGELLSLATKAGWQCGLISKLSPPMPSWKLLHGLNKQVHLIQSDQKTWHDLIASCGREKGPGSPVKPEFLASPQEIEALLEGMDHG